MSIEIGKIVDSLNHHYLKIFVVNSATQCSREDDEDKYLNHTKVLRFVNRPEHYAVIKKLYVQRLERLIEWHVHNKEVYDYKHDYIGCLEDWLSKVKEIDDSDIDGLLAVTPTSQQIIDSVVYPIVTVMWAID